MAVLDSLTTPHPRLAAVLAAGTVTFLAGVVAARTVDPLLGVRLAFVGAVGVAFGAAGYVALAVQRRIDTATR